MRVAVTRPEGAAGAFAAALAARGHEAISTPLLEIRALEAAVLPEPAEFQAILATSAAAFLVCAGTALRGAPPVFAVGGATAAAARARGAADVRTASGDADSLEAAVCKACRPRDGPLLYLCGRVRRADLAGRLRAAGFSVTQLETYDAVPAPELPPGLRTRLEAGEIDAVSFFSPRTAQSFVRLIGEAGLERACESLIAACLSAAVAAELEALTWRRMAVADSPDQEALLAALESQAGQDRPEGAR